MVYNDRSVRDEPVSWENPPEIDNQTVGEYTIEGTAAGLNATMKVSVRYPNLLQNPGFEDEDVSMYQISDNNAAKRSNEDPYEGNAGLHYFFSGDNMTNFTVDQNVTLDAGTYVFTFWVQGHDNGEKYPDAFVDTYAYVKVGDQILKDNFALTGWAQWKAPTIRFTLTQKTAVTVGANITSAPGAWGTIDNFNLYAPLSADTPTQPTNPDETEQPGEPERPGESEHPSEPEQPYKPDQSGTGNSTTNNSTAPNTNTNDANGTTTVSVTTSKTNNITSEKSATPIKTDTIPQTADGFPQTFMIGLMMISLAAFGVLFFWKKKADVATKNQ